MEFQGKSVLITGASAGIGRELALQLAGRGARLTLCARRREKIEALAGEIGAAQALAVECDVTRDGDLEGAVAAAVERWGGVDVVFANAGFGVTGQVAGLTIEDYRRQFETNVFGVLRTVYAAVGELERRRGSLVIIGSVASWVSTGGASAYSMSKFAVRALANSLWAELRPRGVAVTLISPGFVVSEFHQVDNQGQAHAERQKSAPEWLRVPTGKAVREILRAVEQGKREKIVTGHGKVLVAIERLWPGLATRVGRRG